MKPKSHPNTPKTMTEKHNAKYVERHRQKASPKCAKRCSLGHLFRSNFPLNPKGPHSLKPRFSFGQTRVGADERDKQPSPIFQKNVKERFIF